MLVFLYVLNELPFMKDWGQVACCQYLYFLMRMAANTNYYIISLIIRINGIYCLTHTNGYPVLRKWV